MFGGYQGVEGGPDTTPLDGVDLVTLDQESSFAVPEKWCDRSLTPIPRKLDGATVAWVDTWQFGAGMLGNASFSSAHYSTAWTRALLCGGGDHVYNVTRECYWYSHVTDQWFGGPKMLRHRYEAVAVSLPGPSAGGNHPGGQVWMTGGREGSNILQTNEVLQYPAIYTDTGVTPGYTLKRWGWSNEKAKATEIWKYGVRKTMYSLPIPLSGHCVVIRSNRQVIFLGGGTTQLKTETVDGVTDVKAVAMTGPEPSDHVHIYHLDNESWRTTVPDHRHLDTSLRRMTIGRMNHGCALYNSGAGQKIMVAGGVVKTGSGQFEVTNSVEVMDWGTKTWRTERVLPRRFTGACVNIYHCLKLKLFQGIEMTVTNNRPTLFGRYNFEKQNVVLRYEPGTDLWTTLAYKLPVEKSDFALLTLPNNIQRGVYVNPNMNSGFTQINGGSCATRDWRNKLNLIKDGKKVVWRTNSRTNAWIQFDMRTEMKIIKVHVIHSSKYNRYFRFF